MTKNNFCLDIAHNGKKPRATLGRFLNPLFSLAVRKIVNQNSLKTSSAPKVDHTPTHDLNTRANNSPLGMIGFDVSTNQMNTFSFSPMAQESNGMTVLGNINGAEASNNGISIMELSANE